MRGLKLCREEELMRAVLLEFLKSQGTIKDVKGLMKVTVQNMAGASFGVLLGEGGGSSSNVGALKVGSRIQKARCITGRSFSCSGYF